MEHAEWYLPVSAMFVAITILRIPRGGMSNTADWFSLDTVECKGKRRKFKLSPNEGCSESMSFKRRISPRPVLPCQTTIARWKTSLTRHKDQYC